MDNSKLIKHIVKWLNSYSKNSNTKGFIIGVSGGIDSAVTSTLCCRTNLPTICLEMPIYQSDKELERSKIPNFEALEIDSSISSIEMS